MSTNFLYAQAPNRKGNISKDTAKHGGGSTAETRPSGGTSTPKGSQGSPKAAGNIYPVGNKASVCTPKAYNTKTVNDGYINSDRNNYLK